MISVISVISVVKKPLRNSLLEETLSHLVFCSEVDFIPSALYHELETEGEEIEKMLNGYIAYLKKSKQGENEPGANHKVREDSEPYQLDSIDDIDLSDDTTL